MQPIPPSGPLELQLANLTLVSWILLIPVGALLALLLYRLVTLLQAVIEFVTIARYDVVPMLKDLRESMVHVEAISGRVATLSKGVEQLAHRTQPALKTGGQQVQIGWHRTLEAGQVLWHGLRKAFVK